VLVIIGVRNRSSKSIAWRIMLSFATWMEASDITVFIVSVVPWPRVLLMNPRRRTRDMNLPSALNEIVSLTSATVPCQSPTIFAAYCASSTVAPSGAQDDRPKTNTKAVPDGIESMGFPWV